MKGRFNGELQGAFSVVSVLRANVPRLSKGRRAAPFPRGLRRPARWSQPALYSVGNVRPNELEPVWIYLIWNAPAPPQVLRSGSLCSLNYSFLLNLPFSLLLHYETSILTLLNRVYWADGKEFSVDYLHRICIFRKLVINVIIYSYIYSDLSNFIFKPVHLTQSMFMCI